MKTNLMSAMVILALLTNFVLAAEEDNENWLNKHAAIKVTESTEKDGNGNIKSIKIVKDTTIYIKQTITEINKQDKIGNIKPFSRTTVSTDILGGSTTVVEGIVAGNPNLTTISITTTEKTSEGLITTIYARDKSGNMVVLSRTTSVISNNGNSAVVTTL